MMAVHECMMAVWCLQVVEAHQSGASLLATDQYGMTALHHAARFGHKDVVKYLIEQGKAAALKGPK